MGKRDLDPTAMSVADLLSAANPWADWFDPDEIGTLSTWRLAAVLLRDVPVEQVINRLGPALTKAEIESRFWIDHHLRRFPLLHAEVFGFEHWREIWGKDGTLGFGQAASAALRTLDGSPDIRLFAEVVNDFDVEHMPLLWFLLGGVQHWVQEGGDIARVDRDALWLAELYDTPGEWNDQLEALQRYLYSRSASEKLQRTRPLAECSVAHSTYDKLHDDRGVRLASTTTKGQSTRRERRVPANADQLRNRDAATAETFAQP